MLTFDKITIRRRNFHLFNFLFISLSLKIVKIVQERILFNKLWHYYFASNLHLN